MWRLRLYEPSDRAAVRQLAGDTAFFGDPVEHFFDARDMFLDAFANFYTDHQRDYLWIAEEDDVLLGYLMGCPHTRADRRGQGVGTALMSTYLDQLRRESIPSVHLETSSENKIAVSWYEKLGFQLLQRTPTDLYKPSIGHTVELLAYGLQL
jgi:ribosomal protein S18 acetylase RimI-like enzyme